MSKHGKQWRLYQLHRRKASRKARWQKRQARVMKNYQRLSVRLGKLLRDEMINIGKPMAISDEMQKLRSGLDAMGVQWVDGTTHGIERTCFDLQGNRWSVIHGYGTYGGWSTFHEDEKLLELMTSVINDGDPVGWMSAEEVLRVVKEWQTNHA